ncbi:hypothetical protein FS749_012803 [Ceratobasidium sp. UAMH 11750]|nr:hypothetical protein FS749_012803 [Ceratobasidium sp. UAMH 11750]
MCLDGFDAETSIAEQHERSPPDLLSPTACNLATCIYGRLANRAIFLGLGWLATKSGSREPPRRLCLRPRTPLTHCTRSRVSGDFRMPRFTTNDEPRPTRPAPASTTHLTSIRPGELQLPDLAHRTESTTSPYAKRLRAVDARPRPHLHLTIIHFPALLRPRVHARHDRAQSRCPRPRPRGAPRPSRLRPDSRTRPYVALQPRARSRSHLTLDPRPYDRANPPTHVMTLRLASTARGPTLRPAYRILTNGKLPHHLRSNDLTRSLPPCFMT